MAKGKISGYRLTAADASVVKGMIARKDRDHDIAAWFGVNQGRIAEVKDGTKFGSVLISSGPLPPKGPPGVKGRRLRASTGEILEILATKGSAGVPDAVEKLKLAIKRYDEAEI